MFPQQLKKVMSDRGFFISQSLKKFVYDLAKKLCCLFSIRAWAPKMLYKFNREYFV